jgi:4-amino-4-deoxy-L-arabinose transferase-like glycosyltransferase
MKSLYKATAQRLFGEKPSPVRAALGAAAAGTATGVVVYRLLRS